MKVIKKYISVGFLAVGVLVCASNVHAKTFTQGLETIIANKMAKIKSPKKIKTLPFPYQTEAATGEDEMRILPIMDEQGNVISDSDSDHEVTILPATDLELYEVES